jgi:hypothetical protein
MAYEQEHRYLSLRNQSSTVALQHLRYAVLSAEYGSFRRAADALRMRQSTAYDFIAVRPRLGFNAVITLVWPDQQTTKRRSPSSTGSMGGVRPDLATGGSNVSAKGR